MRVLLALCGLLLLVRIANPPRNVLTWDVFGYYLYLPAAFIHHDLALEDDPWLDSVMERYEPSATLYQLTEAPNGGRVIKYSAGMAMAYSPFFLLAHGVAKLTGHPADGFSAPYQYIVGFGCLLYVFLGLLLLRALLLRFFDDRWTALLLAIVVLGTNFLHLAAWDGTLLTHPLLFTLYTGLVLLTIGWHRAPSLFHAAAIGTCAGAITLIRPSEAVCILIPILWGMYGSEERRRTFRLWRENGGHFMIASAAFIIALLPQGIYWKLVAGEWLFYSYANNPGEGFEFVSPWIADFLFSFRKGWFLYTPVMLLAVLGIPALWKHLKPAAPAITFTLVGGLWVAASWSTWWYAGGSFSARSMVPLYPLLALPLGAIMMNAWKRATWRVPMAVVVAGFVLLNLFQTWQWTQGIISKERMTRAYYGAIFGRASVPSGSEELLLVERALGAEEHFNDTAGYAGRILYHEIFGSVPDSALVLSESSPFSPGPDLPYSGITTRDHAWLRTTATLWVDSASTPPPLIVVAFHHEGAAYKYRTATWRILPGAKGWITASLDYLTPEVRSLEDNLKIYVWNRDGGVHRIGELRVEIFERTD